MVRPSAPRALSRPAVVLGALTLVQWIAVGVFVLVVRHNGWLFYQGGDETFFYTASWVLAGGHLPQASIGYGWAYLLSPLARALGTNYLAALPALVLFQTIVLLPIALYCVYGIVRGIGGRALGYFAAAAWIATPFWVIPLWDHSYHQKYVEQFLPQALGLTGLGDFPSTVCLLLAALLCMRSFDTVDVRDAAAAGLATGFAIAMKPANALFLAGAVLALIAARHVRPGAAFLLALLPPLAALAVWKYRGLGHLPVLTSARAVAAPAQVLPIAGGGYLTFDWSHLHKNYVDLRELFVGAPIWQLLPLLGFLAAARRSWPKALLLGGWLAAFVIVKGSSAQASLDGGTLLRLFMPAIPPILILSVLAPLLLASSRLQPQHSRRSPRFGRRGLGIFAAVFAGVPLLLFLALPPLRARTAVSYAGENVMIPVDSAFAAGIRRSGRRRVVSWRAPASPGVRAFYRVFRSRPVAPAHDPTLPPGRQGIRCHERALTGYAGAAECWLEMSVVADTRAHRFVDRPPAGPWVYRVALAANWIDDPNRGDVLIVSAPARALGRRQP